MKWKVRVHLAAAASFLEIFLACMLAIALAICAVQLIPSIFDLAVSSDHIEPFHNYLESLFVLVIGTEALKMLCKHTPGSALEVLLFTIAREMVVKETSPVENLIVVLSIGVIFAIRKFLYVPAFGGEGDESPFETSRRSLRGWRKRGQPVQPAGPIAPVVPAAGTLPADDEITAELDAEAVAAGAAARQG